MERERDIERERAHPGRPASEAARECALRVGEPAGPSPRDAPKKSR